MADTSITLFQGTAQNVQYTQTIQVIPPITQTHSLWKNFEAYPPFPPITARLADGSVVVTWSYEDISWSQPNLSLPPVPTPGAWHSFVQVFVGDGIPEGSSTELSSISSLSFAPVWGMSVAGSSTPVIAYWADDAASHTTGIDVQFLNGQSSPITVDQGSGTNVPYTIGTQTFFQWENSKAYFPPSIKRLSDGKVVVFWGYSDVTWQPAPGPNSPPMEVYGAKHNFMEIFSADGTAQGGPVDLSSNPPPLDFDTTPVPATGYYIQGPPGAGIIGLGVTFSFNTPTNTPPPSTTADMVLRHGSDGRYEIYDIGNNSILASYYLGQVGTDWQYAGLGGFFGTDTTDMLLRSASTGGFEVYGHQQQQHHQCRLLTQDVGKAIKKCSALYRRNRERPSGSGCFTSLVPSVRLVAVLLNPNNPN